jgi:creatinine amidohydrolase
MKRTAISLLLLLPGAALTAQEPAGAGAPAGVLLEELTWVEAERVLTEDAVVVIALGAAAKEHGPHLRLDNDWIMAEYLKRRVLDAADVVVAPTIPYHYYPAFFEYPGSTSLQVSTARDLVVDICRSLARYGPKRFYVLNTGVSTLRALRPAADTLQRPTPSPVRGSCCTTRTSWRSPPPWSARSPSRREALTPTRSRPR